MREELIELLNEAVQYALDNCKSENPKAILETHDIADYLIANGVTSHVRCKDCWYYKEAIGKDSGKPCGYGSCNNSFGLQGIIFDEYFCSYGEV